MCTGVSIIILSRDRAIITFVPVVVLTSDQAMTTICTISSNLTVQLTTDDAEISKRVDGGIRDTTDDTVRCGIIVVEGTDY
jgi:hypothetical protein